LVLALHSQCEYPRAARPGGVLDSVTIMMTTVTVTADGDSVTVASPSLSLPVSVSRSEACHAGPRWRTVTAGPRRLSSRTTPSGDSPGYHCSDCQWHCHAGIKFWPGVTVPATVSEPPSDSESSGLGKGGPARYVRNRLYPYVLFSFERHDLRCFLRF
jgi:hypothetical protein